MTFRCNCGFTIAVHYSDHLRRLDVVMQNRPNPGGIVKSRSWRRAIELTPNQSLQPTPLTRRG